MFGNSSAVHIYPGVIAAHGMSVDGPGHQFFASAGFANNQHARGMAGHLFRQLQHSSKGIAANDDTGLVPAVLGFCRQSLLLSTTSTAWCLLGERTVDVIGSDRVSYPDW